MTITLRLHDAPSTPLNLRFGVAYAPRVATPPFQGFRAIEVHPDVFAIEGLDALGVPQEVFRGCLAETFSRFALHLRMDVP